MHASEELRSSALRRQRRFLILTSLAVIAFYWLGVGIKSETQLGGVAVTLGHPDRVKLVFWIIWVWALWRYAQRVYELLAAIWDDVLEDVYAEDRRIALLRARKVGNKRAAEGCFEKVPKSARVRDRVNVIMPTPGDVGEDVTYFRDYLPTRQGGRRYPTLVATFDWIEGAKWGSGEERFNMELTRSQACWLRIRAWVHSFIRLSAFSEHIAPFVIAIFAAVAPFILS